jgi:ring-1,2-phenylacetyl-CoA epoxidase subunit PaaC
MQSLKNFLYTIADDNLILGHRNSEWTGLGPVLEEDIAFSSMAQDKVGLAYQLYQLLHTDMGEGHPDKVAFARTETEFKCCQLVEYPIGEYDFSLVRHFLFDHAMYELFSMLTTSAYPALAQLAVKVRGELKYHVLHADTWLKKLGNGSEESKARMQSALNYAYPLALGTFEPLEGEQELVQYGYFEGMVVLQERWLASILPVLETAGLKLPVNAEATFGGRKGYHTEYLAPLLKEMTEVFSIDPEAEW